MWDQIIKSGQGLALACLALVILHASEYFADQLLAKIASLIIIIILAPMGVHSGHYGNAF